MLHPYDRPALKARAKEAMRKVSPNIYLVSLVCLVLTNAPTFVTEGPTLRLIFQADSLEQALELYNNSSLVEGSVLLSLATMAMSIFLSLVSCGYRLYALRASREEETGGLETLFACFRQFSRFFVATLLMELFTMLWTMLFIIPGIIAVLSFSFFGWLFLSLFTFGLLDIWLYPYQQVTFANYYNALSGWTPYRPEEQAEPEFTVEDWWKQ